MGASDFRLQLNPNSDYKAHCVQTLTGLTKVAGTDYTLNVKNIRLYIHIERTNMPINNIEKLYLTEEQLDLIN